MICFLNNKRIAFSLAEMLLVMVILVVMMLALPPFTKKMFEVKVIDKPHGRYECYYDQNNNLMEYYANEGEEEHEPKEVESCSFHPPNNTLYIMIHAVGGGGAGTDITEDLADAEDKYAISYLSYSAIGLWPEWFNYVMQHNKDKIVIGETDSDSFETRKMYTEQKLPYGIGGEPGERISMFFPSLKSDITITMSPGLGGISGDNGNPTTVSFKYSDSDNPHEVINAQGGIGGSGDTGTYSASLSGGKATDFGVAKCLQVGAETELIITY